MSDSILVVGPSWVGDMVMAQSLFMALSTPDADVAIDVVAPPGPFALARRMPQVRDSFPLPVAHGRLGLVERFSLGRRLRAHGYDRAIVLPSSFKSALIPVFARVPVRTGYRGEWRYGLINDVRPLGEFDGEQNVRGYLALAPDGLGPLVPRPKLTVDRTNQARLVADLGLGPVASVVALAPGAAYGPAKRWPTEKYRELANRLVQDGHDVWVLGGPEDRELGDRVARGIAPAACHNLCGRTSLTDAVDLLALARVTVSNDSGLMHVAAAAGSHVVALYGPTPPAFAPPLTDHADIFHLGLECSPCFARDCPLAHHRCLEDMPVEDVQVAITRVLAEGPDGGGVDFQA